MITWSYLFALVWAIAPLLGFGNYEVEPFGLSCTVDWIAKNKGKFFFQLYNNIFYREPKIKFPNIRVFAPVLVLTQGFSAFIPQFFVLKEFHLISELFCSLMFLNARRLNQNICKGKKAHYINNKLLHSQSENFKVLKKMAIHCDNRTNILAYPLHNLI